MESLTPELSYVNSAYMVLKAMNLYVFRIYDRDDINTESKGAVAFSEGRRIIGGLARCGWS
jgi:hypothetical protein